MNSEDRIEVEAVLREIRGESKRSNYNPYEQYESLWPHRLNRWWQKIKTVLWILLIAAGVMFCIASCFGILYLIYLSICWCWVTFWSWVGGVSIGTGLVFIAIAIVIYAILRN